MLGRTIVALVLVLMTGSVATAQALFHVAENQVPVAVIEVKRTPQFTEVRLRALAALRGVCWTHKGVNSPYLLGGGRRHRFLGGDAIVDCPARRDYLVGENMVLRFEPLDAQMSEFSLVEGEGGENQMVDPKSSTERYWNFLRIRLN